MPIKACYRNYCLLKRLVYMKQRLSMSVLLENSLEKISPEFLQLNAKF